ncbi:MAG: hypothetical protein JNM76_01235 [Betaproteobacteria bacterium]|nr:hypothetical protein [Betaproteobacteria bacterium]
MAALTESDPDRHRKAFRIFLESVLLQEFGLALMNDAGFQRIVDQVHEQMLNDPELGPSVADASTLLLSSVDTKTRLES